MLRKLYKSRTRNDFSQKVCLATGTTGTTDLLHTVGVFILCNRLRSVNVCSWENFKSYIYKGTRQDTKNIKTNDRPYVKPKLFRLRRLLFTQITIFSSCNSGGV